MSGEGFLRRWARRKTEVQEGREVVPPSAPALGPGSQLDPQLDPEPLSGPALGALAEPHPGEGLDSSPPAPARVRAPASAPAPAPAVPTMEDVAALGADSDFSSFVARGVDQAVRRSALKKLFADPHFNVMDKLDVYIDDYTKPSPVSEAMLASLAHAKSVFMRVVEDEPEPEPKPEAEAVSEVQLQRPPEQDTQ